MITDLALSQEISDLEKAAFSDEGNFWPPGWRFLGNDLVNPFVTRYFSSRLASLFITQERRKRALNRLIEDIYIG